MLNQHNYRLPLGRPVTFDAVFQRWIAHWPERSAAVRQCDEGQGLPTDFIVVTPTFAAPMTPRYLFDPRFLLTTAGLVDDAPLVPEEDLSSLWDFKFPRRSWKLVYYSNVGRTLPYTISHAINRVLAQHQLYATVRTEARSLCGNLDMDEEPVQPTGVFHAPCGSCGPGQMVLATCCSSSIPQPLPCLPHGSMRFFFNDPAFDLGLSEFASAWSMYDRGLTLFMASENFYHMTCPHVLRWIATDSLRALAYNVVHGCDEVLALVFGYLGRQLAASLVAPLFNRTCAHHPSLLDEMDMTGPWCYLGPLGKPRELRDTSGTRYLRCGHFYAVLSPMLLKHHAMVKSASSVMASLSQRMAVAMYQLARVDVVLPGPEHAHRHRSLMDDWASLWQLFHDPERLVLSVLAKLEATGDHDVKMAPWSYRLHSVLFRVFEQCVATTTIGARMLLPVYDDDVVIKDGVPVSHWALNAVPADAVFFNFALTLRDLHRPMPLNGDVCGPRCFSDGYNDVVAAWVRAVAALPIRRWWQAAGKRARSPRRFDDYDSDATEDYSIEERIEEDEEEEKKVN